MEHLPPNLYVRVTDVVLRAMFNNSPYPRMIEDGTLTGQITRDRLMSDPSKIGAPPGTRWQYIRYSTQSGERLVDIHQFLLPDGKTLGASGKRDPKRMAIFGVVVYVGTP